MGVDRREALRNRRADARAGARDERDLASKGRHFCGYFTAKEAIMIDPA